MHVTPLTWITRALWVLLPFTLGALLGDAAAEASTAGADASLGVAVAAWFATRTFCAGRLSGRSV